MFLRWSLRLALSLLIGIFSISASAQQAGSIVHGVVADPDGAVIPGATVTLTPATGAAKTTQSQSDGSYAFTDVANGTYSMTITMNGFATFVRMGVKVGPTKALTLNAKMAIQAQNQVVQVTAQSNALSVDQDSNASATVIKGKDLEALSDDPDELSSELTALAGPSAGPDGGQIYVDGFTGGQLPPKSSIREIRINQNPFSSQFDRLGYGRVEVFTKPGTDKFHGSAQLDANDSSFNTGDPLLNNSNTANPIVQPPYHTIFSFGNITGPLAHWASFTAGGSYRNIQNNAIFNGSIITGAPGSSTVCDPGDDSCVESSYQEAIPVPQTRWDFTPRLDLALGEKNTLTARYQYEQNDQTNNGVGNFVLPESGSNTHSSENTIQMSDTQTVSNRIINETRFEFQRDVATVNALNATPSVTVSGFFTSGGSAAGTSNDVQNHYEVQNYTSMQLKKNFIRFGGRLRLTTEDNSTTAGTNGVFTYGGFKSTSTPISATQAYLNNQPSLFTITKVNSGVHVTTADVGIYAETDWKPRPNLTISYGLRYEAQNFISEQHDFAPRVSFAYGLGSAKGTPKTVLRGGFGIFYSRFQLANQLTTQQQNGVNQVNSVAVFTGPTAQVCSPSTIEACEAQESNGNVTYQRSSNLRSPYTLQAAIGVDQQIFRGATVSVNYLHAIGDHQFISLVTSKSPIRYQFTSGGAFRQDQVIANFNLRNSRYYSLFGYYALNFANSNTAGATSFPSDSTNLKADWGRATFSTRSRIFLGGSINAPFYITLSPFVIAASGTPYNITTGTDTNGDSKYTDRPAFANGVSGRCNVAGDFVVPSSGESYTPIPINYCTGPALFTMNLRVSKTFGFGPLTESGAARAAAAGHSGSSRGGFGGGSHGGGRSSGSSGGSHGGGGTASTGRRYNLAIGAQAQNLFNYHALGVPSGSLSNTRLFGTSTQLAGNPYTSSSATERLQVFLSFNF